MSVELRNAKATLLAFYIIAFALVPAFVLGAFDGRYHILTESNQSLIFLVICLMVFFSGIVVAVWGITHRAKRP